MLGEGGYQTVLQCEEKHDLFAESTLSNNLINFSHILPFLCKTKLLKNLLPQKTFEKLGYKWDNVFKNGPSKAF